MSDPAPVWERTGKNTMRLGDWRIVRFPWGRYVLDYKGEYVDGFRCLKDAQEAARAIQEGQQ